MCELVNRLPHESSDESTRWCSSSDPLQRIESGTKQLSRPMRMAKVATAIPGTMFGVDCLTSKRTGRNIRRLNLPPTRPKSTCADRMIRNLRSGYLINKEGSRITRGFQTIQYLVLVEVVDGSLLAGVCSRLRHT